MTDLVVPDSAEGAALEAALTDAQRALAEATTNFERESIRDQARAAQAAAKVLKRKDIQITASILVRDAERAIAKATLPMSREESGAQKGKKVATQDSNLSPKTLTSLRSVHTTGAGALTDEEYAEEKEKAKTSSEPLTHKALQVKAKEKRKKIVKPKPVETQPEMETYPVSIECADYRDWLATRKDGEASLALLDPPYGISRETHFVDGGEDRLHVSMDFGKWDKEPIDLDALAVELYRVLKQGGTAIIWYDIWKLGDVKDAMERAGFGMFRQIVWQKTNPTPVNTHFYLSNSREEAVVCVKGGSPYFVPERSPNSGNPYDKGVYTRPIPRHGGKKLHPTQKDVGLFRELVRKHSRAGELVIDCFAGCFTTAAACVEEKRAFAGCDVDEEYVALGRERLS